MALTITEQGSASSTTSSATLAGSTWSTSWATGDMIVVCIAADNNGTAGAASISSVTDANSNTYTQRQIQNNDPGNAAAGSTVAIYTAIANGTLANGTAITVNFSPNTTSKAMYVYKVTAASAEFPKYVTTGGSTGSTANPTITTGSITSGDAVIAALAVEGNTSPTADSDTTNGNWSTAQTITANTGTALTSMVLQTQYKITTGTATQTWNQTLTALDWANAYIVVDAAARFQRTSTDSGTGSESASRTVRRLRTGTDAGAGTESASRVIRKLRTATNAGAGTESASYNIVPGTPAHQRTATGSGAGTESATGNVRPAVRRTASDAANGTESSTERIRRRFSRTATDSAAGTETAVGARKVSRTGTDSGAGTETASRVIRKLRTATDSGTGTESSTSTLRRTRTATGSAIGTESSVRVLTARRTASDSGIGSEATTRRLTALRTSEDAATGTQQAAGCRRFSKTATDTGTGTETPAPWWKSLIFRPPVDRRFRYAEAQDFSPAGKLYGKIAAAERANNIYKLKDGSFVVVNPMNDSLVDKIYLGGHDNFVSPEEKADLIAAGYTVT